ncbi:MULTISPECIES: ABC transporter ATP-binding protein [unclassified Beijerinckia]|uniref:ABC transporter ATP-binding protein n=1 Tax=unclassified Beijerinckia TaxID=2638183 RepID=UPI00089745A4|nr:MULTISPECIES: ABC transporter ATP-binding protein [unclassified Beijerinckia]MDH7799381.1 peptide/nickel transport system ATP-binding protein [Beijerinckia sp. GAS462]SED48334.1 peptide/nickel transport system ATP-binding protein [Beijerinckia sp. 28-YEA-48]
MSGLSSSNDAPVLIVDGMNVDIAVPAGKLHAVTDVSFSVRPKETLCLVGESGCGKTITSLALMRLLPRFATLTARNIAFEGHDLAKISERQMARLRGYRMGMIFQDPMTSLNPVYTIGDQLEEVYLRHHKGASRKMARERAEYLLGRVGIINSGQRLGQYPHQLSGGLRQRMMIAMMLMCEPALIIADEPTTALDVTVQVQILQLLRGLQEEFNMAMILITHNLGVVARTADQVAVMYAGRVVEQGSAEQVFHNPAHPYTRGLLDCMPKRGQVAANGRLGSIPGIVPSLVGNQRGCSFRNRCSLQMPACHEGQIDLRPAQDDHLYRCLLDPNATSSPRSVSLGSAA